MGRSEWSPALPLRVDVRSKEVWKGSTLVKLTRRAFAVLCCLVNNQGTLVTKELLFRSVWHVDGVVVGESSLTTCIHEIRKALNENAKNPQYIETVSGLGYRFIGLLANPENFPPRKTKDNRSAGDEKRQSSELVTPPGPVTEHFPIVGRESELENLHRLLRRMLSGERQVVFVTGEAGIGKTTLVRTFMRQVAAMGAIGICFGQCLEQFGPGEPYRPLLEAIGRACRDPRGAFLVEWMKQYTPTWLLQMPTLVSVEDLTLLERKSQGASRERMLREMGEGIELLTEQMPIILVLEDLQWSDTSTLDFLALLARRQERARLMVIGTYRPEEALTQGHPLGSLTQELFGHKQGQEIPLALLDEARVEAYIDKQFPAAAFPIRLPRVLYQATGGNPLFLAAVIDDLKDRNVIVQGTGGQWVLQGHIDTVLAEVPASIRQLIERQITRLSIEEQQIVQAASIAGLEFSAAAVAAAVDMPCVSIEACCEALSRRRHFLQPAGYSDWPDGLRTARYRFRHAMYQYLWAERVPLSLRHQFHLRIGQRLEAAYERRVGEIAAELALHFEQGGDYSRALRYLQQAAHNAMRRYSHREAILHLRKGLECVNNLPSQQGRLQQELSLRVALGPALIATKGYGAEEVEWSYNRALELCRYTEESPQLLQTLWGLESFYAVRGKFLMAREISERCLRLVQQQNNSHRLLSAHWTLGQVLSHLGDLTTARTHLQQAITLYHPREHRAGVLQDPGVTTLAYLAKVLWIMGYPDQARERIDEALLLAEKLAHPFSKAFALTFAADIYSFCGEAQAAYRYAQEAIALCQEQGFPAWQAFATVFYGRTLCMQQQWPEGIKHIRRGLKAWQATGAEASQPLVLAFLADACAQYGQVTEGLDYIAQALVLVEQNAEQYCEAELYRLKGELLLQEQSEVRSPASEVKISPEFRVPSPDLHKPDPQLLTSDFQGRAEGYFCKAIDIARQQQAKSWELRVTLNLARLWQQQARIKDAYALLSEVCQWFHEGENTHDLSEARSLLATLSAEAWHGSNNRSAS